jgi:hypothetical protein
MQASQPNVILGYEETKRRPVARLRRNGVTPMSIKHEIAAASEVDIERHMIGDQGHWIALNELGGDGREKWAIHNPAGEPQGFIWGRGAAEAACKQLIEEGRITR